MFEKGGIGDDLPTITLPAGQTSIVQLFVKAGLSTSGKEAKRLIAEGGAKIDDVVVSDAGQMIDLADTLKLSAGKKRHVLVRAG